MGKRIADAFFSILLLPFSSSFLINTSSFIQYSLSLSHSLILPLSLPWDWEMKKKGRVFFSYSEVSLRFQLFSLRGRDTSNGRMDSPIKRIVRWRRNKVFWEAVHMLLLILSYFSFSLPSFRRQFRTDDGDKMLKRRIPQLNRQRKKEKRWGKRSGWEESVFLSNGFWTTTEKDDLKRW